MNYDPINKQKIDLNETDFPAFAKNYLNYLRVERNLAPGTIANYAMTIQTFLRWFRYIEQKSSQLSSLTNMPIYDIKIVEISSLTRADIYEFLTFCANDLNNSSTSRANKLSALKSFFSYLKDIEAPTVIRYNPTLEISAPKKEKPIPKFLTIDDAKLLLETVKNSHNDRDYCIILWFLSCGMRLTELASVNLRDIRKNRNNIDLFIRGKGRKERLIPLNAPCFQAYETYLIQRNGMHPPKEEEALFLSNRGTRLSRRQIERIVEKYLMESGLHRAGYNAHLLRHSFASTAFELGGNVVDIGSQLGHESIATTQRYVHLIRQNRQISEDIGNAFA